ncbi:MAG: hypothetical protein HOV80_12515 [Polyangiaceae bacterium]|nr:hypothetical protein [Polyangiaceae bacterium]
MTELAYVRAAGGAGVAADVIEAGVRRRSGLASARVVLRAVEGGVTLEPFVASSSVAAMLEIPKKVDEAVELLRAVIMEVRRGWDEALVVRRREGAAEAPARGARFAELGTVLASEPVTLRIEDVLRRYKAEGAEVELYAPADLGGKRVVGYFAAFEVAAGTDRQAEALREHVAEEGRLVGVDAWSLLDVVAGAPPGIERIGGRAYFGG